MIPQLGMRTTFSARITTGHYRLDPDQTALVSRHKQQISDRANAQFISWPNVPITSTATLFQTPGPKMRINAGAKMIIPAASGKRESQNPFGQRLEDAAQQFDLATRIQVRNGRRKYLVHRLQNDGKKCHQRHAPRRRFPLRGH